MKKYFITFVREITVDREAENMADAARIADDVVAKTEGTRVLSIYEDGKQPLLMGAAPKEKTETLADRIGKDFHKNYGYLFDEPGY